MSDVFLLIFVWQDVQRRFFWPSFHKGIISMMVMRMGNVRATSPHAGFTVETHKNLFRVHWLPYLVWHYERVGEVWQTERGCHLLASRLVRRASREYQSFGMFSLTSSPFPESGSAKSPAKQGLSSPLILVPPPLVPSWWDNLPLSQSCKSSSGRRRSMVREQKAKR